MDAFDADALIYAAVPSHPLGRRVAALIPTEPFHARDTSTGVGSLLLLPEVLSKPLRDGQTDDVRRLSALLNALDLRPLDRATAELAVILSTDYRLRAADATHLATAIIVGADRFITTNRRDFSDTIEEIQIVYPDDLPDPLT